MSVQYQRQGMQVQVETGMLCWYFPYACQPLIPYAYARDTPPPSTVIHSNYNNEYKPQPRIGHPGQRVQVQHQGPAPVAIAPLPRTLTNVSRLTSSCTSCVPRFCSRYGESRVCFLPTACRRYRSASDIRLCLIAHAPLLGSVSASRQARMPFLMFPLLPILPIQSPPLFLGSR